MKKCNYCNADNMDSAVFCEKCGQRLGDVYNKPPMPDSHLVWAILTTLFCCLPLGIVSIVQASKVSGFYYGGNYQAAQEASESAKKFAIISAIVGLIGSVLYFFLILLSAL